METPAGAPKLPWFRNNKNLLLDVTLSLVIVVPTVVHYRLGYNSVNGTHAELVTGYRSANYFSATLYITVHVWYWAWSLDTQVNRPDFILTAIIHSFQNTVALSGIIY